MNWFHRLPDNLKGIAYLMLASLVFSLMALLIKLLGQRLHITQILLVRQIGMTAMVAPAILRNFPGSLRSERPGLQLLRVFFALVAMLCGFTAIIHMPLADATAIFFAKSFFVTIFAVVFLAEIVGVYRWGAVLIGFVGVLIMLQPGTDNFSIYGLASLFGFLVFDQFPGMSTWFGAFIVVAAAIFMIYRETRRKRGWIVAASRRDGES